MKPILLALGVFVGLSACKHPRNYYLQKSQRTTKPAAVEPEQKQQAAKPEQPATQRRTAGVAPSSQRVAVEIIKQMQLGKSIEGFVANVYTRVGNRKTYLATKMPCRAARGTSNDEGTFNCQFMPNDMGVNVKIVRGGTRTASVTIPGDPEGPHEMNCSLKYDHQTFNSRGPEATQAGSVLHRLEEVTCVK